MCQRVVIALARACNPQLQIADEPTTGLDVTTQKAVMDLIVELTKRHSMSTILITHDLGLAAAYCDRVVVMEKGRVVETAKSADIFANPQHAYTKKLMRATPQLGVSLRDLLPEDDVVALAPPTARAESPPHPDLLRASSARLDPASGEKGKRKSPCTAPDNARPASRRGRHRTRSEPTTARHCRTIAATTTRLRKLRAKPASGCASRAPRSRR